MPLVDRGPDVLLEFRLERSTSRNSNLTLCAPSTSTPPSCASISAVIASPPSPELKRALGTSVDVTVFRTLKPLDSLSSYSHRGGYYTLRAIARFGPDGLWSHEGVWFSRYGALLATADALVTHAPAGYLAEELARAVHVEVHDPLHALTAQGRLRRTDLAGVYLYTAAEPATHRRQLQARHAAHAVPLRLDASTPEISPQELGAAIILFYSLLDEQQRRLYAGLERARRNNGRRHRWKTRSSVAWSEYVTAASSEESRTYV